MEDFLKMFEREKQLEFGNSTKAEKMAFTTALNRHFANLFSLFLSSLWHHAKICCFSTNEWFSEELQATSAGAAQSLPLGIQI